MHYLVTSTRTRRRVAPDVHFIEHLQRYGQLQKLRDCHRRFYSTSQSASVLGEAHICLTITLHSEILVYASHVETRFARHRGLPGVPVHSPESSVRQPLPTQYAKDRGTVKYDHGVRPFHCVFIARRLRIPHQSEVSAKMSHVISNCEHMDARVARPLKPPQRRLVNNGRDMASHVSAVGARPHYKLI